MHTILFVGTNDLDSNWKLVKGHLAIRHVFSLIARISKTEFLNCPDDFAVCLD